MQQLEPALHYTYDIFVYFVGHEAAHPSGTSPSGTSNQNALLSTSDLTLIFMRSCSRKNMAVKLEKRLIPENIRIISNVSGKNKRKLDPNVMEYVRKIVFQYFSSQQVDTKKDWGECTVAIDESCRRLKNKPTKRKSL